MGAPVMRYRSEVTSTFLAHDLAAFLALTEVLSTPARLNSPYAPEALAPFGAPSLQLQS
jgi:hypothetical protein